MLTRRPLIGIPAAAFANAAATTAFENRASGTYPAALAAAGAIPVVVPLDLPDDTLAALCARLDGLCLAGGVDVAPEEYGELRHPQLGATDTRRDATELKITRWALAADLPVFGICRGNQLLNVAAGGSLYQDIPSDLPAASRHAYNSEEVARARPTHDVRVTPDSRLAGVLGCAHVATNSFHHQAVKQVAAGFRAVAWATDGVVEGIEAPAHRFALGVQWHPEEMVVNDVYARRLFEAFVAAASAAR